MIFRVVKAEKGPDGGGILGYEFIEVLSSEIFALTPARGPSDSEDGVSDSWALLGVSTMYVCRTEHGLTKLNESDLWGEIEAGTYCEDTPDGHAMAKKTREVYANPPWLKNKDKDSIVEFDVDEAVYIGDGDDGCYFQVDKGPDKKYYVTIVVDTDTGSLVENLETDSGPFDTEDEATEHGQDIAIQWCLDNEVHWWCEGS